MFLENKYTRTYFRIIDRAKSRVLVGYIENHHVVPKVFGGTETVALTAKEHFVVHLLLPKMVELPEQRRPMAFALWNMMNVKTNGLEGRYQLKTGILYERARLRFVEAVKTTLTGVPKTAEHRANMRAAFQASDAHRAGARRNFQLAAAKKRGVPFTEEHRKRISEGSKRRAPATLETRLKMSISAKKRGYNGHRKTTAVSVGI